MRTHIGDLLAAIKDWVQARRSFDTAFQATARALLEQPERRGVRDPLDGHVAALVGARKMAWTTRLYSLEDPRGSCSRGVANALARAADLACDAIVEIVDTTQGRYREAIAASQDVLTMTAIAVKAAAANQVAQSRMWQAMTPAFDSLADEPHQQRIFAGAYQSFTGSLETFHAGMLEDSRAFEDAVATLTPVVRRFADADVVADAHLIRHAITAGPPPVAEDDRAAGAWRRIAELVTDANHVFDRVVLVARRHADARGARAAELTGIAETFAGELDLAGLAHPAG